MDNWSNNYPPGAANDPDAPFNQKDTKYIECEECNGTGIKSEETYFYDKELCVLCDGIGEIDIDLVY